MKVISPPKKLIFAASKDQSELTILMFKTLAGKVKKAYMATLDFILKKLLLENQSMKSCKTINTLLVWSVSSQETHPLLVPEELIFAATKD